MKKLLLSAKYTLVRRQMYNFCLNIKLFYVIEQNGTVMGDSGIYKGSMDDLYKRISQTPVEVSLC